MEKKKAYGLFTTITMIVGIVIGSGIYFRADDIFIFTNGNLFLGIMVLVLGALCIIFGSLSFSYLSRKTDGSGGLVNYFEHFISKEVACGFGWFQIFVYMPAISVIVGWAAAIYTFMLFGIDASLEVQIGLSLFYNLFFVTLNTLNRKLGGYFQNLATTIKIIPLLLIAIYGIFFANPVNLENGLVTSFGREFSKLSWITALVPLAYSYDGWTIALNIAPEVINPKKNMTRALIISPLIILFIYIIYIFGMYNILGPDQIINLGDSAIFEAGKNILGDRLANVLLAVVVLSVLGVTNGLNLGAIRMPQALAEKRMIPDGGISKIDDKRQVSYKSSIVFFLLVIFWSLIHFIVMKYNLFNGRDISEISIVFSYVTYIALYKVAFDIIKKENKKNLILPILATLGSLIILVGSILASPFYVILFMLISASVMVLGYLYKKKQIN